MLVLLSTASLWLVARARVRPSPGRLVAWALVAALALWTHYFALFVVAPEALVLLVLRGVPLLRRLLGPALVALAASPLPALALTQRTRRDWFLGLPLPRRVAETGHLFLVGFRPPATSTAFAAAAAAVAVAVALLVVRADRAQRRGAVLAAVVGLGAVAVPVGLALAGTDYVNGRNLVGALVPLLVVVAAGLGRAACRRRGSRPPRRSWPRRSPCSTPPGRTTRPSGPDGGRSRRPSAPRTVGGPSCSTAAGPGRARSASTCRARGGCRAGVRA